MKTPEKIVILIPAYNEEQTITKVIADFQRALPEAEIYVYDNNSEDKTSELAREAGAQVVFEPRQGKGNFVCSMFHDTNADYYIMVDAADTYPAAEVDRLFETLRFFGILALFFFIVGILVGISVLVEFARTQFITCVSLTINWQWVGRSGIFPILTRIIKVIVFGRNIKSFEIRICEF